MFPGQKSECLSLVVVVQRSSFHYSVNYELMSFGRNVSWCLILKVTWRRRKSTTEVEVKLGGCDFQKCTRQDA